MAQAKPRIIARDISWLSFNARVLQEAADKTVPLRERVRFLGIFSNNLDEFFRVRVATLKRMMQAGSKRHMHLEENPQQILDEIQMTVLNQQSEFARIWDDVQQELKKQKIFLVTETELNAEQQAFDARYLAPEFRTGRVTNKMLIARAKADRRLARARSAAKAARRRADELNTLFNAEPA